jgi:hypothetical protein
MDTRVRSGGTQGSILRPSLFNTFITDLCNSINHCKHLIFADELKRFRVINSPHDCLLHQSDINSETDWCVANSTRLNVAKTSCVIHQEDRCSDLRTSALQCYHYRHHFILLHLSIYLSTCLPVYLPIYLFIFLSTYLSICSFKDKEI